jgi:ABC-type sugar transport system substrate-binding protein
MKLLPRRGRWLATIVCFSLLSGCGGNSQPGSAPGQAPPGAAVSGRLFGLTLQNLNNPFFVDLETGIKSVIEKHGDRLVTLDAQMNNLKQKNDISDFLQQQPVALFLNPVDGEAVRGSLIEARRKNVPVIVVDAPVSDSDMVLCQVASDNVEAGRLAAEALAKVNPHAKIVILHYSVNRACIDRVDGFKEVLARNPGMTILDTQEAKGTIEAGRPVMSDFLGRYPDLDAAFPINDPGALGSISAIESAGKLGKVTVVTVDGSREGAVAIKAGKLHSTSAQFPKEIGRVAAETIYNHLAGKPVPKEIKIPVKLITRENADEFLKSL